MQGLTAKRLASQLPQGSVMQAITVLQASYSLEKMLTNARQDTTVLKDPQMKFNALLEATSTSSIKHHASLVQLGTTAS